MNHNDTTICLQPVGYVKNKAEEAVWGENYSSLDWQERAVRMKAQLEDISEVVIDKRFTEMLDGVEEFSHLVVCYFAHRAPDDKPLAPKVHPMGNKDFPLVGIFATHSPLRPNGILFTTVKLKERQGNVLRVTGLDALNGSPILDIKPYHPGPADAENVRVPAWRKELHSRFDSR